MQIDLIALMKISKIILLSFSYSQIILHAYRTCSFIIYIRVWEFFFHIAHYEKFSLWVKFRFIQMYYFIFLYKKNTIKNYLRHEPLKNTYRFACNLCSVFPSRDSNARPRTVPCPDGTRNFAGPTDKGAGSRPELRTST